VGESSVSRLSSTPSFYEDNMILSDVLNRIKFKIGSNDDIASKAINPLVSTSNILYELNAQTKTYAHVTRGIRDVFSTSITTNDQFLNAPTYALRSGAYNFALMISRGLMTAVDIRGQRDVTNYYRVTPLRGIGSWLMIYNEGNVQRIYLYPMSGTTYNATTLSTGITASDTTIPVVSTSGFLYTGGRITIGTEKILYQYKDTTNFYGCVRGLELSTAAVHVTSDAVKENNLVINYCRLPVPFTVTDTPSAGQLATELEVVEDHIEGLCDIVAYSLLSKVSPERAKMYKVDGMALLEQYKVDINRGYGKMRSGVNVQDTNLMESGIPMNGNRY
jgi:hypothetical protein